MKQYHDIRDLNSVLVIEDHHLMRLAIIEELKSLVPNGLFFGASDLDTALKIINIQPIQLIITDPGLPGFDPSSYEDRFLVIQSVLTANPEAIHVVMTGNFSPAEWSMFQKKGVKGYWAKTSITRQNIESSLKHLIHDSEHVMPPTFEAYNPDLHYAALTEREQQTLNWVRENHSQKSLETLFEEAAIKNGIEPESFKTFYKRARTKLRKTSISKEFWQ